MRRLVRDAIRKGPLTKSQRDVTLAVMNHWFHHKSKRAPIHPGREKLAAKAGVTVKTVSRTLAMLRSANVIVPVGGIRGGFHSATKYRVQIGPLMTLCGCDWLDDFVRGYGLNVPQGGPEMSHKVRDKMSHGLMSVAPTLSQGGGDNA